MCWWLERVSAAYRDRLVTEKPETETGGRYRLLLPYGSQSVRKGVAATSWTPGDTTVKLSVVQTIGWAAAEGPEVASWPSCVPLTSLLGIPWKHVRFVFPFHQPPSSALLASSAWFARPVGSQNELKMNYSKKNLSNEINMFVRAMVIIIKQIQDREQENTFIPALIKKVDSNW